MSDHTSTTALVTGGSQGLGYAIARQLINDGCRSLVITGRDSKKGDMAASELAEMGATVHFMSVDMMDTDAVQNMVVQAVALVGPINALVNTAARTDRGSILDTSPEEFDLQLGTNLKGPFFAIQAFANHCIQEGHSGGVVNILSIVTHGGASFLAPYVASKAGLLALTKNAAASLMKHKIRLNGINVGWMDTPGEDVIQRKWHGRQDGWLEEVESQQPFGMLVKPQHVARQVSLFLSPDSGVVTGSILDWDQQVIGAPSEAN